MKVYLLRNWPFVTATFFTLTAALLPALLWVGDISWLHDESGLITKAWFGNKAHILVERGLAGNFSINYGPLPTQIYQFLLLLTHDPIRFVKLRIGLCVGTVALSLLWLARNLRFNPWFAASIVLAPYLWLYNRIIWDANFALPFGAMTIAAYAAFLRHGVRRWFLLAGGCALLLLFIHPQDLPLTAAVGGHILWRQRLALRRYKISVLIVISSILLLNCVYLYDVLGMLARRLPGLVNAGYPGSTTRLPSFLAPLLAGRLLAGNRYVEWETQVRFSATLSPMITAVKIGSSLIFPLMWIGIAVVIWRWIRVRFNLSPSKVKIQGINATNTRDILGGVALAGIIIQSFLYGLLRVPAQPQYFFGSFAMDVLLAWIGLDILRRVRWLQMGVIAIYSLCGMAIMLSSIWQIHHVGYDRNSSLAMSANRPTFANQLQVARELNRYSDDTALSNVMIYLANDGDATPLRCLRLFTPPVETETPVASGRLVIRYVSPDGNQIELLEATRPEDVPPDAKVISCKCVEMIQ